jgi:hypothetical protein
MMAERGKVSRTIEDLREFKDKFKLSGEIERDLKKFHQNFKLQTTVKNGEITGPETKEAPNTLSLLTPSRSPAHSNNNHKKKRHKKQPPKALQFTDVYELVGDELGRGAYSSVATCRRINDGKEFAVKV